MITRRRVLRGLFGVTVALPFLETFAPRRAAAGTGDVPPFAIFMRQANGVAQQKLAVDSGVWPLYRFDPRRLVKGEAPLKLDYGPPKVNVVDYLRNESRFRTIERADPERYQRFVAESQAAAERRYAVYEQLAGITVPVIQPKDDKKPLLDVVET